MKVSTRALVVILAVCCLAVAAGIMAERALASGSTVYCGDCTLSSDGVPAVSTAYKGFYYNDMATNTPVDPQIYNYYGGTVSCSYHGYTLQRIWTGYPAITQPNSYSCNPTTIIADARCHLLDGIGPAVGFCYADYQTVG